MDSSQSDIPDYLKQMLQVIWDTGKSDPVFLSKRISVTPSSARTYKIRICDILGADCITEAVVIAAKRGLIQTVEVPTDLNEAA